MVDVGALLQPLASPSFADPWGLGGSMYPALSPALFGGLTDISMSQEANAPPGRQLEKGRAGTSWGVWEGRPVLGNSWSSSGRAGDVWFPGSCRGPSPGGSLSSFEVVIL